MRKGFPLKERLEKPVEKSNCSLAVLKSENTRTKLTILVIERGAQCEVCKVPSNGF